jgi:hypothetical protein
VTRPAKAWLPSAADLRRATAARDNTNMNAAEAARLLGYNTREQQDWVRLIFSEGRGR